jgi:hypothetical protein
MGNEGKPGVFVSHVHEDAAVADYLRQRLSAAFLERIDVYVSSARVDHAGEDWLDGIEQALRDCSVLVALCTPSSITKEWVNFELGAAWMLGKPIVPACHGGLTPDDLPAPLSSLRAIELTEPSGVQSLYATVAKKLEFGVPEANFDTIAAKISELDGEAPVTTTTTDALDKVDRDRDIRARLRDALTRENKWRTVRWAATEAAVPEDTALDILRADPTVRFSQGQHGDLIVGLIERVGKAPAPAR